MVFSYAKSLLRKRLAPDLLREDVHSFLKETEKNIDANNLWKTSDKFKVVQLKDELNTHLYSKIATS
jgi:hypothetical protein